MFVARILSDQFNMLKSWGELSTVQLEFFHNEALGPKP
jgi:hypothetical protein